jgi:phosphatidylserine/phosphatidylglycerophosphate/cardiolipin synthase-like enzyme
MNSFARQVLTLNNSKAIRKQMKQLARSMSVLLLAAIILCNTTNVSAAQQILVYFSPNGGCTEAVVTQLAHATNSVLVQAYSFTSAPIAKALVDASKRGVKVQVILDKSQKTEKYSSADFLRNSGISTYIDARHAIAHNKVMVIDDQFVITGSFNFTKAAEENNAENLLIIDDASLAAKYSQNWQTHFAHSEKYTGKSKSKQ